MPRTSTSTPLISPNSTRRSIRRWRSCSSRTQALVQTGTSPVFLLGTLVTFNSHRWSRLMHYAQSTSLFIIVTIILGVPNLRSDIFFAIRFCTRTLTRTFRGSRILASVAKTLTCLAQNGLLVSQNHALMQPQQKHCVRTCNLTQHFLQNPTKIRVRTLILLSHPLRHPS